MTAVRTKNTTGAACAGGGNGFAAIETRIGMTKAQTFANVWDAVADSPEEGRRARLKVKVDVPIR